MIPPHLVSIFNAYELELLISGLPVIDPLDWQNNSTYANGYTEESPQIKWFWKLIVSLQQEELALLLQFGEL